MTASNVEWIEFNTWNFAHANNNGNNMVDSIKYIIDYMSQISFKSLKVFDFGYYNPDESTMERVNKILKMVIDQLKKRRFHFSAFFSICDEEEFDCLFDAFCQKIFNLMIKDKIPINIVLEINNVSDESKHDEYYDNTYLSYFSEKIIFKDYKPPQCNKYCVPLIAPKMSFIWDEEKQYSQLIVRNATEL